MIPKSDPADTGYKLNVHKTFSRRPYVRSICVVCLRGTINFTLT